MHHDIHSFAFSHPKKLYMGSWKIVPPQQQQQQQQEQEQCFPLPDLSASPQIKSEEKTKFSAPDWAHMRHSPSNPLFFSLSRQDHTQRALVGKPTVKKASLSSPRRLNKSPLLSSSTFTVESYIPKQDKRNERNYTVLHLRLFFWSEKWQRGTFCCQMPQRDWASPKKNPVVLHTYVL